MGYGIDRNTQSNRLWTLPILYEVGPGLDANRIQRAAEAWGDKLFKPMGAGAGAPLKIQLSQSISKWTSGDSLNGKCPTAPANNALWNTLQLKSDSSLGTIIHELGHALGLSHEQDHPDCPKDRKPKLPFAADVATLNKGYVRLGSFDPDSIMLYGVYQTKEQPSVGDFKAIEEIYQIDLPWHDISSSILAAYK